MTFGDGIAHRHLLPVDGLEAIPQSEQQHVRIIVSERWASSEAGQLTASCLVNLLCRQTNLVGRIEINSPEKPVLIRLPNGEDAGGFPNCLHLLAEWAVKGATEVSAMRTVNAANYTIFIGDAPAERIPSHGHAIALVGDGWKAWVGDPRFAPRSVSPTSSNPLGPFLAAALGAGEIFKHCRGIRRGGFLSEVGYSLWSGASSPNWCALETGPEVAGIALPSIHLVGVGAVGNALAYTIAQLGLSQAYLIPIDDDSYDDTNLNRCLLAGWRDLSHPKIDAVSRALLAAGLDVFPFQGTIKSYVAAARVGLRAAVAAEVSDLVFKVVASCVDKGTPRQDIQGLSPRLLVGGSTFDLQAKSNIYTGRPEVACLACFNPRERDGEKIRALESKLRNMQLEERSRFLIEKGLDSAAVEEYLSSAKCGLLGEAALREFATRMPTDFSVGFVSLGAGLLLASALLRSTVFLESSPHRAEMTTLNFLNGGLLDSVLAADDACERKCQSRFSA